MLSAFKLHQNRLTRLELDDADASEELTGPFGLT